MGLKMLTIRQQGFTLIEMLVTVAILSILLMMSVPAVTGYMQRHRIIDVAELVYSQLQYARSESIARSSLIYVSFSTDGSENWAFGISENPGCDPTVDDNEDADACILTVTGTPVLHVYTSADYTDVSMGDTSEPMGAVSFAGGSETRFDPLRGTARVLGTVVLKNGTQYEMRVVLGATGRTILCSPDGATKVAGYRTCP